MIERSCRNHIVLVGVGHTNAHIVRMWGMKPIADTDLTCISDRTFATYSGRLPAVLAGQIPKTEMEIDLVRLCASVNARLITDRIASVDHDRREICFADRPPVPFDVLSVGIGSVPIVSGVQISGDSLIKIKPMQTFLPRLRQRLELIQSKVSSDRSLRINVVGSGVAGIEILFCLPGFLKEHFDGEYDLSLVTSSKQVLPSVGDSMRQKVVAEIDRRGHAVHTSCRVREVSDQSLDIENGQRIESDLVIWATGASAPPDLSVFGLPTDDRGFLLTDATLQSTAKNSCFAVGDTGTIQSENLPKAGVYAVRQGPILWENIQRKLLDQPLTDYRPQRSFLKLINTGDGNAIGEWKGRSFAGRWVMRLKERIDGRFMEKYKPDDSMSGSEEMQCRGCGCKLGAEPLNAALPDGVPLQDAAVVGQSSEGNLVASTDFFSSPLSDPFLTGRIAALHSASDIIATGGRPTKALANVVVPDGNEQTQQRTLSDFLAGAKQEFDAMGATIVGGHTIVGPRMEVGFTVIGQTSAQPRSKSGLKAGDHLCLSKPIGIGVLLAAHMRAQCPAEHYTVLLESILRRQHKYANVSDVTAMTDVTGFGLAGHLIEMLQEGDASAELVLSKIPILPGVVDLIQRGVSSSLAPDNHRFQRFISASDRVRSAPKYEALFDPQTCGGYLFGVPQNSVDEVFGLICDSGLETPTIVGVVTEGSGRGPSLSLIE